MTSEIIVGLLTALVTVLPLAAVGLIAWGRLGAKVDNILPALDRLSQSIDRLTVATDNHGDRLTVAETKLDYVERRISDRPLRKSPD